MKKVLVIFPMIYEAAAPFAKYELKNPQVGDFVDVIKNARVHTKALVAGFGCTATRERIKKSIAEFNPELVILAGFCGSCREDIKNGDKLSEFFGNSPELESLIKEQNFRVAKMATVDRLADESKKRELAQNGFDAVEMEAMLVREILREQNIPFLHLRWVSDSVKCKIELPFFESTMNYETGEIKISAWNLIKFIARRPKLLFDLMAFNKELAPSRTRYAEGILEFLKKIENF